MIVSGRRTLVLLSLLAACDAPRAVVSSDDAAAADRGGAREAGPVPDIACHCKPSQVWLRGPCVGTDLLGACVVPCNLSDPASCPADRRCDPWAATDFCHSAVARPACVRGPGLGFPPETLRISPRSGIAGKPLQVRIEGGDYYIGALVWQVAFGSVKPLMLTSGGTCVGVVTFTPPRPGVYPVSVGYGSPGQALAGFFTASGGVPPPAWVQPGYPCSASSQCASAAPYSCSCTGGRCRCSN
jgi:hypothetical protein